MFSKQSGNFQGSVLIRKYSAVLDSDGNVVFDTEGNAIPDQLIEEQESKNTWTQTIFNKAFDYGYITGGGASPIAYIGITSATNQDKLKNFAVASLNGITYGSLIPGGNASDNVYVDVDSNTRRYTTVRRFNPPAQTTNIDQVALFSNANSNTSDRIIAYTVLNTTCVQDINTLVDIYYRLYLLYDDTVAPDTYTQVGNDHYLMDHVNALAGAFQLFEYLSYQKSPTHTPFSQLGGGNLAYYLSQTIWQYNGYSSTVNRYYSDCSHNYVRTIGTGTTSAMGKIAASKCNVVQNSNNSNAYYDNPKTFDSIDLNTTNIVQNIIAHSATAVSPFKDVDNLPTSKGTIAVSAGTYNVTIPEFFAIKITNSGETSNTTATYQVYKKPQVGYQYNSSTQKLNYTTGYAALPALQMTASSPVLNVNYYGNINAIHKFQNPFGATTQPTDNGQIQQLDINIHALSGTEVVSFDSTGITVVNIANQGLSYTNYDSTTTPALNVTAINQIACNKTARWTCSSS